VRGSGISTEPHDNSPLFENVIIDIMKAECLGGAARRIVPGIKVGEDFFALEIFQDYFFSLVIRQCECRGFFPSSIMLFLL